MYKRQVFTGARAFTTGTSEDLFRRGLTLPSGAGLRDDEVDRVIGILRQLLGAR